MTKAEWGRLVYGLLDFLQAALYLVLFLYVVPSRSTTFTVVAVVASGVMFIGGIGMMVGGTWGHRAARICCTVMIVSCFVLIGMLVSSAAYLHGIYNGIGEAGSIIALVVAALAIEFVGLVPTLQLIHLRRHSTPS